MPKTTEVIALSLQIFVMYLHSVIRSENKNFDLLQNFDFLSALGRQQLRRNLWRSSEVQIRGGTDSSRLVG